MPAPTNGFSAYTTTLSTDVDTSTKSRTHVRTLKGTLYDQELEKEARIINAKKSRQKQALPTKTSSSSIRQSEMLKFAPCLEDPYESASDQNDHPTQPTYPLALLTENLTFKSVVVYPRPKPKPLKKSIMTLSNTPSAPNDSTSSPEPSDLLVRSTNSISHSNPPLLLLPQKCNSSDGDVNSERPTLKISNPPGHERKCAKGTDVPYDLQGLLKLSIADYCSMIATHCPFPDLTECHAHAQAALTRSSNLLRIAIKDEESYNTLVNLLLPRASHMCGELRMKLTPLVASNYGFKLPVSENVEYMNRELVKMLLFKDAFLFQEPNRRHGLYSNPILQIAINEMWFQNDRDEGVKFSKYFNPIPFPVIALIFTVKSLYSMACKAAGVKSRRDLEIIDDENIAIFEQDNVSNLDDDSDAGVTGEDEDTFSGFGDIMNHSDQDGSDQDQDQDEE
ncbi:hypothetical protein Clacol_010106 [Clathrus columnatus]|uniref:DUF6532 domain-containing protein n=1 Tax=Clathrus columnatus TaxID=1419009 RepID=A0AAV5AQP3_9AGAM|nr:hypothetical protein Clacol_010106 [Clathrus columnatus]